MMATLAFNELNIDDMKITPTDEVTLLSVFIDNKLTFKNHIDELCRKASYRLHTLRLTRPFLSKVKARLLANSFISCQFLYAPLIWMFAGKKNQFHFRTFQIVHNAHGKL